MISSTFRPVRSSIFKIMRGFAGMISDQNYTLFDRIMKLLQWTEMSHMWMIMDHLYGKNPEVLCYPELRGAEKSAMLIAIKFLKKYSREDRPYLKLLEDHNNLIPLQSKNFIYFAAAAQAIAGITQPSMKNMSSRYTEAVKAFQNRVLSLHGEKVFPRIYLCCIWF